MSMLRRSDPNLPSTSSAAIEREHNIYASPYDPDNSHQHQQQQQQSAQQNSNRKKHFHRRHRKHENAQQQQQHEQQSQYHHQIDTASMQYPDDDDLFLSSGTIASNLLTSLKQPSKMTFNWSRQFNETLATISGLLQRNFQENPYPGCNVSEASASTATLGSSNAIDSMAKCQTDKWQKRRRNSLTGDPRELDMLVLEPVNGDDSDGF